MSSITTTRRCGCSASASRTSSLCRRMSGDPGSTICARTVPASAPGNGNRSRELEERRELPIARAVSRDSLLENLLELEKVDGR